jgi:hypothetical protein
MHVKERPKLAQTSDCNAVQSKVKGSCVLNLFPYVLNLSNFMNCHLTSLCC